MPSTLVLVRNEFRMMLNHLWRSITTPSMLFFYSIMVVGGYFIAIIVSAYTTIGTVITSLEVLVTDFLTLDNILSALGIITISSVVSGYAGMGAAAVLQAPDEYVLMPAPVWPHQVFLSRYFRRIVRRLVLLAIVFAVLSPLLLLPDVSFTALFLFLLICLVYFEFNYLLSSIASLLRSKVKHWKNKIIRWSVLISYPLFIIVLALPLTNFSFTFIFPSKFTGLLLLYLLGLVTLTFSNTSLMLLYAMYFLLVLLVFAFLCDQSYYEKFTSKLGESEHESVFVRVFRREIDFSELRTRNAVVWILLKDFWSGLRSPLQVLKYLSFAVSMTLGIWLWIAEPFWFRPLTFPPVILIGLANAFILILILLCQIASLPSLNSFIDEKENIYLLKACPIQTSQIVLAKFIGSLIQAGMNILPFLLFITYLIRIENGFLLSFFVTPVLLVMCATGTLIGAVVPVFTSEPANPSVPLVFSFPTLGLGISGAMAVQVLTSTPDIVLIVIPTVTLGIVSVFLWLAAWAFDSYR